MQDLDWGSAEDIARAGGPFSFVLAADCVYNEGHVPVLHDAIVALTDFKSTGASAAAPA